MKSLDDVEGMEKLQGDDMQTDVACGAKSAEGEDDGECEKRGASPEIYGPYKIENARSSRATCKGCHLKIEKGEVRVSTMVQSESIKFRGKIPAWRHVKCLLETGWDLPLEELPGWDGLNDSDQNTAMELAKLFVNPLESAPKVVCQAGKKTGSKRKMMSPDDEVTDGKAAAQNTSSDKSSGKRMRRKESEDAPINSGQLNESAPVKVPKKKGRPRKVVQKVEDKPDVNPELLGIKEIIAIVDNLQKYVSTADLKKILIANGQDASGSEQALREQCADGMVFGLSAKCPMCSSGLYYHQGFCKCIGFLSAHSKGNNKTLAPKPLKDDWKIPEDIDNDYLLQWQKTRKMQGERIFASSAVKDENQAVTKFDSRKEKHLGDGRLKGVTITILGRLSQSQAKWKERIEGAEGRLISTITSDSKYVIVNENDLGRHQEKLDQARNLKIPVLREAFLIDCLDGKKDLSLEAYAIDVGAVTPVTKAKVSKGRSAVHEESCLQDIGHILKDGDTIYNTTLNTFDVTTGKNSYYILQIIEEDEKPVYHLFRKWGRVGSKRSKKSEKFSKETAINIFKSLFFEKTGNDWEAWEKGGIFEKKPNKYYPLEIEQGMEAVAPLELPAMGSRSKRDSRVISLLKLLFDAETYRSAMSEYEINVEKLPLGKLSRPNIQQGFQILTEIQGVLASDTLSDEQKDTALKDASSRFFALIPATNPHVMCSDEELRSKTRMLVDLREMEIASSLIGAVGEPSEEDPLDTHYKNLHCDIAPLPQNSPNYGLIKKYFERTLSSHKDWTLELEDVFVINREGEAERFEPFKKKMDNHMLLWHGAPTTNFVGILSQGLRIAPPEAPGIGYLFGKGLYFTDLVSRSAQYCHSSKDNPIGLMLLCEVALGKVNEVKSAQYIEKSSRGTNSTKGLGRTKPDETQFDTFRGNVTVPCGRPVASGIRGTDLLYNEYIVYDPAQVKARFMLKLRFRYKR